MSNIKAEEGVNEADIEQISGKRLVFIIDEAHRTTLAICCSPLSTPSPMRFSLALPVHRLKKKTLRKIQPLPRFSAMNCNRYSIADGIRDENVLGFHPFHIRTFKDSDLRRAVALREAKAVNEIEAFADEVKKAIYNRFMNDADGGQV